MANLHVLSKDGDEVRVVAHVAIPAGNNAVGVPWRTAVLQAKLTRSVSILPTGTGATGTGTISSTEVTALANGSLVEVDDTLKPTAVDLLDVDAYLIARYNAISAAVLARLQAQLNWYGRLGG